MNACIFACFILSFLVLLLNDELGYDLLCAVQICACLVRWQQTWLLHSFFCCFLAKWLLLLSLGEYIEIDWLKLIFLYFNKRTNTNSEMGCNFVIGIGNSLTFIGIHKARRPTRSHSWSRHFQGNRSNLLIAPVAYWHLSFLLTYTNKSSFCVSLKQSHHSLVIK